MKKLFTLLLLHSVLFCSTHAYAQILEDFDDEVGPNFTKNHITSTGLRLFIPETCYFGYTHGASTIGGHIFNTSVLIGSANSSGDTIIIKAPESKLFTSFEGDFYYAHSENSNPAIFFLFKNGKRVGSSVNHDYNTYLRFISTGAFDEIRYYIPSGGLIYYDNFEFVVDDICLEPSSEATNSVFGTSTINSLTLTSFTAPSGGADGYVVFINTSNSFEAPSEGLTPTSNTQYSGGQQAVYYGASTSPNVTVSALEPGTTYYFKVYAYNDCHGTNTYESTGLSANDMTAKKALTITGLSAGNKIYDGNTTAIISGTPSLSGVISGHTVTLGGTPSYNFTNSVIGIDKTISTVGYSLSGTDASKYVLLQPTFSADITTKELTVADITAENKVYDGSTTASTTGTAALSGVVENDQVTLGGTPTFTFASADVASSISISTSGYSISGNDASNYSLTQPTLSADITTKELTVVDLSAENKVYDGIATASTTGTAALEGLMSNDEVTLGGTPSFTFASTGVGSDITVNTSGYSISGNDASNYSLSQPVLSADISAKELTISGLTAENKEFDDNTEATVSGTPVLEGAISGDDVTLGGTPEYTFASADVGADIEITTKGYSISGDDADNYNLIQPTFIANITTVLSADESSLVDHILIYPNPTTGTVSIKYDLNDALSLRVFNSSGQQIKSETILSSFYQFELIGSSGMYFIELIDREENKANFKIVKR
ncbi:YDG domain-containing protein [Flammeovirga sp. SubArs3]|uniref:YDG domain-containing protein n=1 Tax=Flammeovirga sp. SubArs3 TaxID=2995316 RepID=UPI00248C1863|nr:YDG domain-containing protein [Flammeovirga sp. SubArs3]